MRSQSRSLKTKARLSSIAAQAEITRSNAQAAAIRAANKVNMDIAAANLRAASKTKTATVSTTRAARATSGFTSEGTGSTAERNAAAALDREIANMAFSASNENFNSWQQAQDIVQQGKISAMLHNMQSEQYTLAAKATQRSLMFNTASTLGLTAASTAYNSFFAAQKNGFFGSGISHASAMNTISDFANAWNPYTAALSPVASNGSNNWAGNTAILLGRIPKNGRTTIGGAQAPSLK